MSLIENTVVRCGACTIVSPNYLAYARTLSASYRAQHPGQPFFVLVVADTTDVAIFSDAGAGDGFVPVALNDIGLDELRNVAMKYDILELNTNVKPTFLKHLISRYGLEKVVYLDPDIFVYSPLTAVFDALEANDAVLTPHLTAPIADDKIPSEQDILYNGTYNLGFFGVRGTSGGLAILSWWERRCLDLGFSEGRTGLFVDQKWMNLAPGLFERVAILRHLGCNMAFWNLHERRLSGAPDAPVVNGSHPLCFFHFSGLDPGDATQLSRNTDRFTLASRPDLQGIFASYRSELMARKNGALEAIPYGFDTFSDGTAITRLSRRIYSTERVAGGDPFDAEGPWLAFCRRRKMVAGRAAPAKSTWAQFSGEDRRVKMVHQMLRFALRAIGPNRYELLMRYLSFITVLRNQSVFLGRDRN